MQPRRKEPLGPTTHKCLSNNAHMLYKLPKHLRDGFAHDEIEFGA